MIHNRKRGLVISILVILLGIGYLAMGRFGENLVYFFTPSEVVALSEDYAQKKIRVGGMVKRIQIIPDSLKIVFELTDGDKTIQVNYEGIPPDLFKERQGAVVEGYWKNPIFDSKMIMAKHSEDYMPPELRAAGKVLPKKDFFKTLQP